MTGIGSVTPSDSDRWPRTIDGRTVWACCVSTIGPPCQHRAGDDPETTPTPAARCPYEYEHDQDEDEDESQDEGHMIAARLLDWCHEHAGQPGIDDEFLDAVDAVVRTLRDELEER